MMIEIRLTKLLYRDMMADLVRPHAFAGERVGFVYGKLGNLDGAELLVLLYRYSPVCDSHYIDHPHYVTCISGEAIRRAMQDLLDHREANECVFHVHIHDHQGIPRPSQMDQQGIPPMIRSFSGITRRDANGFIILSKDHGRAWVWLAREADPVAASRIVVVGSPISIFGGTR